ncbi:winged helix-turn-helix domain-containing protein [Pelagibacteraceae bacterium]|nr:winged helix-turn-helix domain-containing protein [Pelagibacteraceae bacterium]
MSNLTISIFGNRTFSEILQEVKLFSKYKIKHYEELKLCLSTNNDEDKLIILFSSKLNNNDYININKNNFPLIIIHNSKIIKKKMPLDLMEKINIPFRIFDLYKKIIFLTSKYQFKKSSLINLNDYIIDKNERKIKRNDLELKLTEKEINFLILFSKSSKPVSRSFVLKNVWNYSSQSETHTVETHIHRLRKKILNKFKDKNFIKNNNDGYYI